MGQSGRGWGVGGVVTRQQDLHRSCVSVCAHASTHKCWKHKMMTRTEQQQGAFSIPADSCCIHPGSLHSRGWWCTCSLSSSAASLFRRIRWRKLAGMSKLFTIISFQFFLPGSAQNSSSFSPRVENMSGSAAVGPRRPGSSRLWKLFIPVEESWRCMNTSG